MNSELINLIIGVVSAALGILIRHKFPHLFPVPTPQPSPAPSPAPGPTLPLNQLLELLLKLLSGQIKLPAPVAAEAAAAEKTTEADAANVVRLNIQMPLEVAATVKPEVK